jgi:uncharacterized protein YegP (UPF0339 family)
MAKFTVYQDIAGYWRWRFQASNGRIVADSAESYYNRADAEHGIRIVKIEGPSAPTN